MPEADLELVDDEDDFQEPDESAGKHIIEHSKDRTKIVFDLGGEEYTAFKPKKTEEWFIQLQMAMSSDDQGLLLLEIEQFFKKVVGAETHAAIKKRRLDDEDDLTWLQMSEVMYEIFELWTSEADKPTRPTGRRSVSSTGKRRTTRR